MIIEKHFKLLLAMIDTVLILGFGLFVTLGTLLTAVLSVNLMYANNSGKFYGQLFVFESILLMIAFIIYMIIKKSSYIRLTTTILVLLLFDFLVFKDNLFQLNKLTVFTLGFFALFIISSFIRNVFYKYLYENYPYFFRKVSLIHREVYVKNEIYTKETEAYKLISYPSSLRIFKVKEETEIGGFISTKDNDNIATTQKILQPFGKAKKIGKRAR